MLWPPRSKRVDAVRDRLDEEVARLDVGDRNVDGNRCRVRRAPHHEMRRCPGLAAERPDLGKRRAVHRDDLVAREQAGLGRRAAVIDVGDEALAVDLGAGDADAAIGHRAPWREQPAHVAAHREAEHVGEFVIIHLVLRVAPGMGGVQAVEDEGDRVVDRCPGKHP